MSKNSIFLLAFLEGFSVLTIELLGGKLIIPYFGNSLVIWTSTIGVTMTSLMIGYFLGGMISKTKKPSTVLFVLFSLVSVWMSIMPILSKKIISIVEYSDLYSGSIISAILLFSFPLILLGSIPPSLIELAKENKSLTGKISGSVFSTSTLGSIVATLFLGFIVLEIFGVSMPLIFFALIIFITSSVLFYNKIKDKILFALFGMPLVLVLLSIAALNSENDKFEYISEGLQGQLRVYLPETKEGRPKIKSLQINGVSQTTVSEFSQSPSGYSSIWLYPHQDAVIASYFPPQSKALLLGFGAGSVGTELTALHHHVDIVEIDSRLLKVASKHFGYNDTLSTFYVDDARHYIKKCKKKYDIIIMDLLHGEVQPNHVLTIEGLTEVKKLMTDSSLLVINYQSNLNEPGKPFFSILKTLESSGFDAKVTSKYRAPSDFIFIASKTTIPKDILINHRLNLCCYMNPKIKGFIENPNFLTLSDLDMEIVNNAIILKDDLPILETLNQESIKQWRENMIKFNFD